MPIVLQRYLVRRNSGDVYVWSERLAARGDLEEVWAPDPKEALLKQALPKADEMSLDQLEGMQKTDLLIFCRIRLGLEVDETMTKQTLCDHVRENLWSRPVPEEAATMTTRSFKDVTDIRQSGQRGHAGDRANIAGSKNEGAAADQSVRS